MAHAALPQDAEVAWTHSAPGRGPLEPHEVLLRLDPQELRVSLDGGRAVDVDPDVYACAEPDPVAAYEAEVLQHLVAGHADAMQVLVAMLPPKVLEGAARVVPVRLDRHRLVLRIEGRRGLTDVPLPLAGPGPARTAEEVLGRLRTLLRCGGHDPRGASALGEQEA